MSKLAVVPPHSVRCCRLLMRLHIIRPQPCRFAFSCSRADRLRAANFTFGCRGASYIFCILPTLLRLGWALFFFCLPVAQAISEADGGDLEGGGKDLTAVRRALFLAIWLPFTIYAFGPYSPGLTFDPKDAELAAQLCGWICCGSRRCGGILPPVSTRAFENLIKGLRACRRSIVGSRYFLRCTAGHKFLSSFYMYALGFCVCSCLLRSFVMFACCAAFCARVALFRLPSQAICMSATLKPPDQNLKGTALRASAGRSSCSLRSVTVVIPQEGAPVARQVAHSVESPTRPSRHALS